MGDKKIVKSKGNLKILNVLYLNCFEYLENTKFKYD